jgi:hypothetical protein
MLKRLKNWLKERFDDEDDTLPAPLELTGAHVVPRPKQAAPRKVADKVDSPGANPARRIEDAGPGKTVLIRNKYVREDTGTHETLKILDESIVDSGEETGIDPYNTGGFDRSKNWSNRFRK